MTFVTADAAKVVSIAAAARMRQTLDLGRATGSAWDFEDHEGDARALFEIVLASDRAGVALRANPHVDAANLHLPAKSVRVFEALLVDWIDALDTYEPTASLDGVWAVFDSISNAYVFLHDRNAGTHIQVERSVIKDLRRTLWEATGRVIEPKTVEVSS